ncbi:TVP38/TMEM64 family protein [Candidatus Pelagibacter sp.]|uniref:TVP38/TMEM64 family protein n=1 Tax=Candidatus Pelagibacter sp. TaxID=2024849 RepID=UPI003D1354DE
MKKNQGKIFFGLIFFTIIIVSYSLDINKIVTFEKIKDIYQDLQILINQNYYFYFFIFFISYVVVTAFALPISLLKTLLAGALFGFWPGLILVSFASSIGSTFCFLFSRYALRAYIQKKFSNYLDKINKGIETDGWLYLLFLRLSPIFPFFIINLVFGLTKMKTLEFYIVSQIGMFIATAIFVNAGVQIANINSLEEILSFKIIASLTLIGIFPLLIKYIYNIIKNERAN